MLFRLVQAHEIIIEQSRTGIERTEKLGDWGTNDLLMGDAAHERAQAWFIHEQLVGRAAGALSQVGVAGWLRPFMLRTVGPDSSG
jgi:hypothetical protein